MLGSIIGDIIGSPYEFALHKSVDFLLITNRSYFTDDAVMTCAIAEALMNVIPKHGDIPSEKDFEVEVIKSMQKFGKKYYYDLTRPLEDIRPYVNVQNFRPPILIY